MGFHLNIYLDKVCRVKYFKWSRGLFMKFARSMESSFEPTISHPTDIVQVSTFALGTPVSTEYFPAMY
jgi:hypothetical protein